MRTHGSSGNTLAVLFNATCASLLSCLYQHPHETFYLREISRKIHMGAGTVQRELARLVAANLVVRQVQGRHVYYGANSRSPVYREMRGLIIKTFGLADIVRDALRPFRDGIGYAFIHGSQADGTSAAESDVDLMIVGDLDEMKLHRAIGKAEGRLGRAIQYSLLTTEEFSRRKKEKGGFVDRVASGKKIVLVGDGHEI